MKEVKPPIEPRTYRNLLRKFKRVVRVVDEDEATGRIRLKVEPMVSETEILWRSKCCDAKVTTFAELGSLRWFRCDCCKEQSDVREIHSVAFTATTCDNPYHFNHRCNRAFWIGFFAGTAITVMIRWLA